MKPVNSRQNSGRSGKEISWSVTGGEGSGWVWWRPWLRKAGLILTAISGALLSSTLSLPWYVPALATVAGISGSILTILTQADPPPASGSGAEGVARK